ncbi:MAG: methyltransferase domain-containing protein [Ferruginibacter sp.]
MEFLQNLISQSRLLEVLHENLPAEMKSDPLYLQVEKYLAAYCDFNNISAEKAIHEYTRYISQYNKDCKAFAKTGEYPLEADKTEFTISRESYDVVLMLSVLFTRHRFSIMSLLQQYAGDATEALYIGLGSGLEIDLTKNSFRHITGYDLTVNDFLATKFPSASLHSTLYTGQQADHFDAIFLIELLEHLDDPYDLIKICYNSLKKNGRVLLTTATDIPQFDHLYKFAVDHMDFEEKIKAIGFRIVFKEKITHQYLSINISPCNHFYVIEKA